MSWFRPADGRRRGDSLRRNIEEADVAGRLGNFPAISPEQAHGALRWLVATGRVQNAQIRKALRDREQFVAEVKARLEALGGEGLRFLIGPAALQRRLRRKRRKASAKARAAWRL
jgi:hypothetical protein